MFLYLQKTRIITAVILFVESTLIGCGIIQILFRKAKGFPGTYLP